MLRSFKEKEEYCFFRVSSVCCLELSVQLCRLAFVARAVSCRFQVSASLPSGYTTPTPVFVPLPLWQNDI